MLRFNEYSTIFILHDNKMFRSNDFNFFFHEILKRSSDGGLGLLDLRGHNQEDEVHEEEKTGDQGEDAEQHAKLTVILMPVVVHLHPHTNSNCHAGR